MLDVGRTLEPDRLATVRRLRETPPVAWHPADVARIKEGMTPGPRGVPRKYAYGSDFPYRGTDTYAPLRQSGVDTALSFARGGLSTVWGAAILPYHDRDLAGWPLTTQDLAPHYRAVLQFVPISAVRDDLDPLFPLYANAVASVAASHQAAGLLADLTSHRDALHAGGVVFGQSRIAVAPQTPDGARGCLQCGLCMYGCPHELIYSSAATLEALQMHPDFSYTPGIVVERVAEHGAQVILYGKRVPGCDGVRITADRVYLACGPLSTSRILMTSLELYDTPVVLLDSQYFLLPLLRYRETPAVAQEPLHTLAQLFVEIVDEAVSANTVHLQLYTYNDLYDATFRRLLGPAYPWVRRPVTQLVNRMLIVQGYLHSGASQHIHMTLQRSGDGTPDVLHLAAVAPREPLARALRRVTRRLWAYRNMFRAVPVTPMLAVTPAGRGFHTGGSFPMTDHPSALLQSDPFGRPAGFQRVHCVDATVFPSIPATTITFTVMANAHRIGAHYHVT